MDARVARLRWRCRRGMRELDVLLRRFVDVEVPTLTDAEIAAFEGILDLPDPELCAYLLGNSAPADPTAARLIERIRAGS
jgi:antitoxin CptB